MPRTPSWPRCFIASAAARAKRSKSRCSRPWRSSCSAITWPGRSFEPPIGPPGYSRLLSPDRRPYQTSDGYVCALVYSDKQWNAFFRLIGLDNEADRDPRLNSISPRTRNYDFVYDWFSKMMKTRSHGRMDGSCSTKPTFRTRRCTISTA